MFKKNYGDGAMENLGLTFQVEEKFDKNNVASVIQQLLANDSIDNDLLWQAVLLVVDNADNHAGYTVDKSDKANVVLKVQKTLSLDDIKNQYIKTETGKKRGRKPGSGTGVSTTSKNNYLSVKIAKADKAGMSIEDFAKELSNEDKELLIDRHLNPTTQGRQPSDYRKKLAQYLADNEDYAGEEKQPVEEEKKNKKEQTNEDLLQEAK